MDKAQLIKDFYTAFNEKDWQKMISFYHDDIIFSDPAFGELQGIEAKKMWEMLCNNPTDLSITYSNVKTNADSGSCQWVAQYLFSKTGRRVRNVIQAQFTFSGDKIIEHHDSFNLRKWAGQALGWSGYIFGWLPMFKNRLQLMTNKQLKLYIDKTTKA